MEALQELAIESYDRTIGLELADVAVDGCMPKSPCGGERAGRSPVDRGKRGIKRSTMVDANGIPLEGGFGPGQPPRFPALGSHLGHPKGAGVAARAGERAPRPRLRLVRHPPASGGAWPARRDLGERQTRAAQGRDAVGGGEDELLAQ